MELQIETQLPPSKIFLKLLSVPLGLNSHRTEPRCISQVLVYSPLFPSAKPDRISQKSKPPQPPVEMREPIGMGKMNPLQQSEAKEPYYEMQGSDGFGT